MGNLFCKQTSIPAIRDVATAIEPTGTNFLHTEERIMRIRNSGPAYTPSDFLKHQYPLKKQWYGSIFGFNEYKFYTDGF